LPAISLSYSLDGYATSWNGQQHVTYIGQDGKVHELVYSDNGGWKHNILSDLAKATGADDQSSLPSRVGLLDGYATPWNSQQHVNYIGQDGKVHELVYSDSGGWKHNILNDLAKPTGADDQSSLASQGMGLDGYATPWNHQQHVNYLGLDGKVHELVYSDSGGWKHNILSDLAKATGSDDKNSLPDPSSALDGYATPWNKQQHVNYIGMDRKVHELVYSDNGGWKHNILSDLARSTGADNQNSLAVILSPLDGYATPWNNQQHVNYIGQDYKVHELWYSGSGGWKYNILNDLAGADEQNSLPITGSLLDGYATPWNDQQHINYIGGNYPSGLKVQELWYSESGGWKHNILSDLAKATGADDQNSLPHYGSPIDGYVT
jgi:hypothetical protein